MRYLPLLATSACAMAGCTTVQANVQPDTRVALSVEWQSCDSQNPVPYYSVQLSRDGSVRYVGTSDVREKGERLARMDPKRAERIIQSATTLLSGRVPATALRADYCMLVKVESANDVLAGTLSPLDAPGMAFERQLLRAIDLQRWVCPTRSRELGGLAMCALPTITFNYADRNECGYGHAVHLFADGRAHYFVWGLPESDRYYEISRANVNRLFKTGSKYDGDLRLGGLRVDPDNRTLMGAQMLIEYKLALTELAKVPWKTLPESSDCGETREFPAGSLSLNR